MVREIFGRLNTAAALPRVRAACEEWRPDLVVRDPNEYSSALAAEELDIPHARVAIGLSSVEELGLGIVDGVVDADMLRRSPYLSVVPAIARRGCPAHHPPLSRPGLGRRARRAARLVARS